jgi:hypothetical protein
MPFIEPGENKSDSIISNTQFKHARRHLETYMNMPGLGMTYHIGNRFLRNSKTGQLNVEF